MAGLYVPAMRTVGIVSAGAMGSAVGAAYLAAGQRVVTTVAGRSERTGRLAERAGLELLPDLERSSRRRTSCSRSCRPTGPSRRCGDRGCGGADRQQAARRRLERGRPGDRARDRSFAGRGRARARRRLHLRRAAECGLPHARLPVGTRAAELAAAAPPWLDLRVVGDEVGLASAVKMCTASMYKGSTALLAHALLAAQAHGVLPQVLDDLGDSFPKQIPRAARQLAVSTTKADRFVGEMHEIAATQASVGLTPALFEAMADVYAALAATPLGADAPESIPSEPDLEHVLERLAPPAG